MINLLLVLYFALFFYFFIGVLRRKIELGDPVLGVLGIDRFRDYTGLQAIIICIVMILLDFVMVYITREYLGNLLNIGRLLINATLGLLTGFGLYNILLFPKPGMNNALGLRWRNVILGVAIAIVLFVAILLFNTYFSAIN